MSEIADFLASRTTRSLFEAAEGIQIVDGVFYFFFLIGFGMIAVVATKTAMAIKSFITFKLIIFYCLLAGMLMRFSFVAVSDCVINVPWERRAFTPMMAGFLFSRMALYTSYSMLLILWIRLYHNVFKVKQAIFKLRHFTTYIFIFIHLCFIAIFLPQLIYDVNSEMFNFFYRTVYILFIIIYSGVIGIGFTVFGILLWRNSKNTGKVNINDRILIISFVLCALIILLDIYLIYAYVHKNDALNSYLYRSMDSATYIILSVGLSLLLNRKPASRKSKSGETGNSDPQTKSGDINMDVRRSEAALNSTTANSSAADGLYSNTTPIVEEVSIEILKNKASP